MANTEGLPDEFVESLATAGSSFSSASRQKEQRLRARLRQNRLQQRMDQPMSGSPAAKIIRASPNNASKSRINKPILPDDEASSPKAEPGMHAPPLVGDVIEHKQNYNQSRGSKKTAKVSRFASRNRQTNDMNGDVNQQKHASGFPSVHNVPLGTFVKRKKKPAQQISRQTPTMISKEKVDLQNTSIGDISSIDLMKQASQKESDAMLADMSLEEIKDRQQEIEQALSPDLIAFLKQRRQKKKNLSEEKQETPSSKRTTDDDNASSKAQSPATVEASTTYVTANNTTNNNKLGEEKVEREEKERIAKLVASIRTHEDLDATYRIEMKGDAIDFEFEKNSGNGVGKKKEEFMVACDLLRSSSPRQTLWAARTVSLELSGIMNATTQKLRNKEKDAENDEPSLNTANKTIGKDELPTVLPVSLRCLLDKPLVSSCNYLLHTYALQSLYYLTIIYAHPDHDKIEDNASLEANSAISIFQEEFMDDAVPSPSLDKAYPPMTVKPISVDENSGSTSNDSAPAAAYMTSSSTTSALSDGEEFKKDPMWTLLSKMKIIPRLAFLLEHQQHLEAIPAKAFSSVCGIISMVGQRSPGAASAIMKHKTLTSLILKRMLQQIQRGRIENEEQVVNENNDSDEIVFSALRLFCILSRQSRIVAEDLPLEDILPPLLATGIASSPRQFLLQRHALFLWRSTLRYGLGLEALASMLTISARHFALPYFSEFSLSADFLSSFTLVLECVKVVRSKNGGVQEGSGETPINEVTADIVGTATKMMASTLQAVLPKTVPSDLDTTENLALQFRWNASRLFYLSNWLQIFDPAVHIYADESIETFIPLDYQETLLLTLKAWATPNGEVDKAWNIIPKWGDSSLGFNDLSLEDGSMVKTEAAASAFINAYFTIALVMLRSRSPNPHIEDVKQSFHKMLVGNVIAGLKSALDTPNVDQSSANGSNGSDSLSSARARWINQSQFSVAKFCFHSISVGLITTSSEISVVRGLVFALLGRLQKGDESIAAVLFSSDILFQTSGNPVQNNDAARAIASSSSPISSMFLGEICGSQDARKQLDHSFKLQHGFGITSAGFGLFQLDSLLSNAELPNSAPSAAEDNEDDKSFPLGKLWLWQSLSGSIRMKDEAVASGTKEAAEVIAAVLDLILDLDETEEITKNIGYAGQLSIGSKLYYLMNVCLHHEDVLRDERVLNSGEILLDRYLRNFGCNDKDVVDFCQECLDHSGHSSEKQVKADEDEDASALNGMDKELLDKFSNAMTIDLKDSKVSSEQIRAIVAFVEDLTAAYRDYGAQYDFFTKCVRVFLLPNFPSLIRCRGFRELENMLHLMTVSAEFEDEVEMTTLVAKSLTGGLPAVDDSIRDDNDILNAVVKAITSSSRPLEGYMRHYCIGTLARNFAISLSMDQGVEISKKRLKRLGTKTVQSVCKATELFLHSQKGTKNALVEAIVTSSSCKYNGDLNATSDEQYVVQCLDSCAARCSSR